MTSIQTPLTKQKELHWQTLLLGIAVAAAFFIPFIIMDKGYFLFYGDFNVQQVPFYQMCHDKVRSGDIFWDWNTDLGANFIGSYSFYLLGSPFFWLTIPFPSWMVPHLIGPLLILKFGCAAFTSYFYLRRFTKTAKAAQLGGLLYAFSGFSVYNIFFNHFHEAIVFFPLLLLALELFIAENKRGPLIFATFICALSNYFFFVGMAVFCVIYWFIRMIGGHWKMNLGRLAVMVLEVFLGVALAAALLIPAYLSVMQNDRVNSTLYGWNAFLYGRNQLYLNIIEVFFFPPDLPARPVFFDNANVKWASLGGWLPLFSMTGVIAWIRSRRKSWIKRIIIVSAVMALVPILNSAFFAFNSAYYARWFYMPILIMCLATVLTVEDKTVDWSGGFKVTAIITAIFTLVIGLFPKGLDDDGNITAFGLFSESTKKNSVFFWRFWITCAIAVGSLIILRILMQVRKKSLRTFMNSAVALVCIISVGYAAFFIGSGKTHGYDSHSIMIDQLIEGEVDLPDKENMSYRIDVFDGVDNTGMYLGYPCIQAFHSIVPASIMNFYPAIGVDRGVGSRPDTEQKALRSLLSTKYLLDRSGGDDFADEDGKTKMPGWKYYGTQSGYKIYENENYIPYGFTYDYYITSEQCDSYDPKNRAHMMLKAVILDDEQIARHSDILKNLNTEYDVVGDDANGNPTFTKGSTLKRISFSTSSLSADAYNRSRYTATDFKATTHGFTANIDLDRENLVFFSVPYEDGAWTAYVDGQEAEIEVVNVGFMAVRVPAGAHSIEFKYFTPGLEKGLIASGGAAVIIVIYMAIVIIMRKKRPDKWIVEYPEGEELAAAALADAEIQAYITGADRILSEEAGDALSDGTGDTEPHGDPGEDTESAVHLLDRIFAEEDRDKTSDASPLSDGEQNSKTDSGETSGFVVRIDPEDENQN